MMAKQIRSHMPRLLMDEAGLTYRVLQSTNGDSLDGFLRVRRAGQGGDVRALLRERFALTERESDVAALLFRRATNTEIAEDLGISMHTARHHTERVLQKTRLQSRAQLRRFLSELANEE